MKDNQEKYFQFMLADSFLNAIFKNLRFVKNEFSSLNEFSLFKMENGQNFSLDTMILTTLSSNKYTFLTGSNIETINLKNIFLKNYILKKFLEIKNYFNFAMLFCSFEQIYFAQSLISINNDNRTSSGVITMRNVQFILLNNSKQINSHLLSIKNLLSIDLMNLSIIQNNFENSEILKIEQVQNNIIVIDSIFFQNSLTSIILLKEIKEISIKSSNFIKNGFSHATCVYLENLDILNSMIYFFNVSFSENEANHNGNKNGLSIKANYEGTMYIMNSNFLNNSITGTSISGNPSISIADDKFLSRKLIVGKSIFNYNSVIGDSLNIYFKGNYFELGDSIFKYNFAAKNLEFTFGNLFIIVENLKVENCQIFNNSAGYSIFGYFEIKTLQSSSNLNYMNFSNIQIENNSNLKNNGAIEIVIKDFKSLFKISFFTCSIIQNNAFSNGGGIIFKSRSSSNLLIPSKYQIIIINCSFFGNKAFDTGGVLNLEDSDFLEILIENSKFSNNEASLNGGVFNFFGNNVLKTKECTFFFNIAKNGGVFSLSGGNYSDYGSLFVSNYASNGGGIFYSHAKSVLYFEKTIFQNCSSSFFGGFGVLLYESILILKNDIFQMIGSEDGGFIGIYQDGKMEADNCEFNNIHSKNGDVFVLNGIQNKVELNDCKFLNVTSREKAIFDMRLGSLIIKNISFWDSYGTVVNLFNGQLHILNISIISHGILNEEKDNYLIQAINSELIFENFQISNILANSSKTNILFRFAICESNFINLKIRDIYFQVTKSNFLFYIESGNITFKSATIEIYNSVAFYLELSSAFFIQIYAFCSNNYLNKTNNNYIKNKFCLCYACVNVHINDSLISNMTADEGSIMDVGDLYQSFFYQTRSEEILSNREKNKFLFYNTNFLNNVAFDSGGVFYIVETSFDSDSCNYVNNNALIGGALYLHCFSNNDFNVCNWNFKNNTFLNNKAELKGGAIYWIFKSPKFSRTDTFILNSASQGSNLASNPIKIEYQQEKNDKIIRSGIPMNETLTFHLLDYYGQKAIDISGRANLNFGEHIQSSLVQKFISNQFIDIINGEISLQNFTVIANPGSSLNLLINTEIINYISEYLDISPSSNHKNISNNYFYHFSLSVKTCIRSEIYIENQNLCYQCPDNSYSFYINATKCDDCPKNAICRKGQDLEVATGYWRMNENSSKIIRCTLIKKACLGGKFENQCLIGHTGPLCSSCLYDQDQKYYFSLGLCQKCGDSNLILIAIMMIVVLGAMIGSIGFSIKDSYDYSMNQDLKAVLISVLINIMINYIQLVSIVSNIDIKWPDVLSSSSSANSTASSNPSSSGLAAFTDFGSLIGVFQCPMSEFAFKKGFSIFYVQMILVALTFILMLISNGIFWIFLKLLKEKIFKKGKVEVKNNFILTLIAIYTLMLQPVLNFYTKGFSCIEIQDDVKSIHFLKVAPQFECWEETHMSLIKNVIFPFLFIFIIPPPIIMLLYIRKNLANYDHPQVIQRVFLITIGYRKQFYYWEYVVLLKKIALIYITIFIRDEPLICVLALIIVLLIFSYFHIMVSPYEYEFLNRLVFKQYIAVFVSYSVNLYFSYTTSLGTTFLLLFLMIAANILFIAEWVLLFYRFIKKTLKEALNKTSNILNKFKDITNAFAMSPLRKKRTLMDSSREKDKDGGSSNTSPNDLSGTQSLGDNKSLKRSHLTKIKKEEKNEASKVGKSISLAKVEKEEKQEIIENKGFNSENNIDKKSFPHFPEVLNDVSEAKKRDEGEVEN